MNQADFQRWAKPLLAALQDLEAVIRDKPGDASMLREAERRIRELPVPDFMALGEAAGEEMAAEAADEIAARGRMWAKHDRGVAALAARNPGFSPIEAAIKRIAGKTPVTSGLRSDAWERMPLALREAGQFSSAVESVRVMGTIQDQLLKAVSHQRELLEGGKDRYVTRDSFIRTVRQAALDEGLDTGGGNVLTNIAAPRRIGLIHDMQKAQARGYARWKLDNDPDALNLLPAWRLGGSTAKNPRPDSEWMAKWQAAGNDVGWEGAAKNTFVALKTSPIWMRLSRFGTPWPPFDWGSTRELEDVWRDEAEQLGLVNPADRIEPTMEQDFAEELEASLENIKPEHYPLLKQMGMTIEGKKAKPGKIFEQKDTKETKKEPSTSKTKTVTVDQDDVSEKIEQKDAKKTKDGKVDKSDPVAEYKPTIYTDKKKAEKSATELLQQNKANYVIDQSGQPVQRFSHGRKKTLTDFTGKATFGKVDADTASNITNTLAEIQAENDRIGIPRIRGVHQRGLGKASMGDGILSINPKSFRAAPIPWFKEPDWIEKVGRVSSGFDGAEADRATLWHEHGHHIHQQLGVVDRGSYMRPPLEARLMSAWIQADRGNNSISRYATDKPVEWFAENYALAKMGKKDLIDKSEELRKILKEIGVL